MTSTRRKPSVWQRSTKYKAFEKAARECSRNQTRSTEQTELGEADTGHRDHEQEEGAMVLSGDPLDTRF